jgi:hypothetical protein
MRYSDLPPLQHDSQAITGTTPYPNTRYRVIIVLLLMIASLVLVFLGLATSITTRMQGSSPFVHMVLTYAGLLVTLLSHIVAFMYIIGLRNLLMAEPPAGSDDDPDYRREVPE